MDLLAISFCKVLLLLLQLMTLKAAASHETVHELDLLVAIRSWLMSAAEAEPGPTFSRYTFLCECSEYLLSFQPVTVSLRACVLVRPYAGTGVPSTVGSIAAP